MSRPTHLIVSALAVLITLTLVVPALAHHEYKPTKYYFAGEIRLEVADIQEVWRAKLKTSAYDSETIELLAHYNLLSPVYVDTNIDVGQWTVDLLPLFVTSAGQGAMTALNVTTLESQKGDYREGDEVHAVNAASAHVQMHRGVRAWFALDADGTLLAATDGAPLLAIVEVLH